MKQRNLVLLALAFVLAFMFGAVQTAFAVSDGEETPEGPLAGELVLQDDDDLDDPEDDSDFDEDDDEDFDDDDGDFDDDDGDFDDDDGDFDDDDDDFDDDDDDFDFDDDDEDFDDDDDDGDYDDDDFYDDDDEDDEDFDEDEFDLTELDVVIYDSLSYDKEYDEYVYELGSYTLTGKTVSPKPYVAIDEDGLGYLGEEHLLPLEEGIDYKLSYKNNTKLGKATVVIKGIGDYTGSVSETFMIGAPISKAKVAKISAKTYTGKPIKPNPKVTFKGKTLKKGTDYTLSYKANIKAGTGKVIVKGKGANAGTKTVKFTIRKCPVKKLKVGKVGTQKYTGKQLKPNPKVTFKGKTLKKGKDYTLKYANNKAAGSATITVMGKGSFTGKRTVSFTIAKPKVKASSKAKSSVRKSVAKKSTARKSGTSTTVYITNTGAKYHRGTCRWLHASKIKTTKKEAIADGYEPCKVCKP